MLTWYIFAAVAVLGASSSSDDSVTPPPGRPGAGDSASVQVILARYQEQRQRPMTGSSEKEAWKVRMECLAKLMKIGPAAVPVLIDRLKDEQAPPYTRAFAAQALGFLADARARPALLQAIEDRDGFVRAHARVALGRLGRLEPTPRLRELAGKDPTSGASVELTFALTRDDAPNPEPIRSALRDYDLARMDGARLGKPAPDFTLADASGKTWRLGQFRGKQPVVLVFLGVHN
jgi:hypothetical protein